MKNKKSKYVKERIALAILIPLMVIMYFYGQHLTRENNKLTTEYYQNQTKIEELESNIKAIGEDLEVAKATITTYEENIAKKSLEMNYRLTSYYTGDSTNSTTYVGAGLNTSKFQVNSKGWYTYKGKVVVATATYECLNAKSGACGNWNTKLDGITYYNYYDELNITVDGTSYEAVVLDSCGACMTDKQNRIDVFVSNKDSAIDRGYKGNNEIQVSKID